MKHETRNYYQQKVNDVIVYIKNNLNQELSVKSLAERFHISYFHFHRIVKAAIEEPLGDYISKLRLETALNLIRYTQEPLKLIAIEIGYNDLSAFSKSFKKEFGISPEEYRQNRNNILNTGVDFKVDKKGKIVSSLNPKFIVLSNKEVVSKLVYGEYGGKEVEEAWDDLIEFATKNKLFGWKTEAYSVYLDDPDIVESKHCRSEICIATKKDFKETEKVKKKELIGGKFALFRYKGSYDYMWELHDAIYKYLVSDSNMKLRNAPIFEKYLNYSENINPDKLVTEVYIPIE